MANEWLKNDMNDTQIENARLRKRMEILVRAGEQMVAAMRPTPEQQAQMSRLMSRLQKKLDA